MTREENLKKFYKEFKGQLPNPVFERMAEEFSRFTDYIGFAIDQESDGSSVDFNFLLPGKILISVTGLNDFLSGVEGDENVPELPPEMMSINIFHNRECLVSDFMILEKERVDLYLDTIMLPLMKFKVLSLQMRWRCKGH